MCHWIQPSSLSSLLSPFSTGGIVQKASVRSACQPCQWPNAGQPHQHLFCTLLTQYCSRVSWVQIPPKAALPFSSKERVVLGVVGLFALPLPSYLILLLTHVQVSDDFALMRDCSCLSRRAVSLTSCGRGRHFWSSSRRRGCSVRISLSWTTPGLSLDI